MDLMFENKTSEFQRQVVKKFRCKEMDKPENKDGLVIKNSNKIILPLFEETRS